LPAYHLKEHSCQYAELGISSSGERTAKLARRPLLEIPSKSLAWLHGELRPRLCRERPESRRGFFCVVRRKARTSRCLNLARCPASGKVAMSFASQTLNTASNGGWSTASAGWAIAVLEVLKRRRNKRPKTRSRTAGGATPLSRRKTHDEQSSARTIPTRWFGRSALSANSSNSPLLKRTSSRRNSVSVDWFEPCASAAIFHKPPWPRESGRASPVWPRSKATTPRSHSTCR